jgi:hypothetical protein
VLRQSEENCPLAPGKVNKIVVTGRFWACSSLQLDAMKRQSEVFCACSTAESAKGEENCAG